MGSLGNPPLVCIKGSVEGVVTSVSAVTNETESTTLTSGWTTQGTFSKPIYSITSSTITTGFATSSTTESTTTTYDTTSSLGCYIDRTDQHRVQRGARNWLCSTNRFRCESIGVTRPTRIWKDSTSTPLTTLAWSTARSIDLPAIMLSLPMFFTAKEGGKY